MINHGPFPCRSFSVTVLSPCIVGWTRFLFCWERVLWASFGKVPPLNWGTFGYSTRGGSCYGPEIKGLFFMENFHNHSGIFFVVSITNLNIWRTRVTKLLTVTIMRSQVQVISLAQIKCITKFMYLSISIQVPLGANGCAYFQFGDLCDKPLGAADYFGLFSESCLSSSSLFFNLSFLMKGERILDFIWNTGNVY